MTGDCQARICGGPGLRRPGLPDLRDDGHAPLAVPGQVPGQSSPGPGRSSTLAPADYQYRARSQPGAPHQPVLASDRRPRVGAAPQDQKHLRYLLCVPDDRSLASRNPAFVERVTRSTVPVRGTAARTHAMTCTETTADRICGADCTGISRSTVPRPVARPAVERRSPLHYRWGSASASLSAPGSWPSHFA